jgi:hypothetical protein
MSSKKIVLQLTQGQREHMKMLTGLGPARLTIDLATTSPVPFGTPWSTKLASKAVQLNGDQKEQIRNETGQNYEYLMLSKANVEKWMKG